MEKRMKDYQTPQRDQGTNRRFRKPQKIVKSLTATLSSPSDDKIQPISKEEFSPMSIVSDINQISDIDGPISKEEFSPMSIVSDINQISDINGSFLQGVDPTLSASCESLLSPNLSPSSVGTFESKHLDEIPVSFAESNDLDEASVCSLETEIALKVFRRALTQVLQSTDVDHRSKKLIDACMRVIVDDFIAVPQERDLIAQLLSVKSRVLSLCLFLWIIVLAFCLFFGLGDQKPFNGPLPT